MIAGTHAEYESDPGSTKDIPYLALTGELWGVFCEYFWENWPRYNGTALYHAWTNRPLGSVVTIVKYGIFRTDFFNISCEIRPLNLILHSLAIRQDPIDDEKSALVQVMACCCQAASHYLNQCRPKFTSPYDVTGPQWIKPIVLAPWWSYVLFKLTLLYNQICRKNSIPLCCVMQICWEASFIPV